MIVLSEQEVAINQWLGANRVLYLPRLLSPDFINWQPVTPNAGFVGTLDHLPNALGIEKLADELQLNNFAHKLQVIGGPPHVGKQLEKKYPFIQYKGPVPDSNLVNEVKTWSVFLNPVFWYARGASTKLAQAINWGMPTITTPAGRRGYYLTDETIVADDNTPKAFAQKLIKALKEPEYLLQLKKASESNAENFDAIPYINQLKNFLLLIAAAI
jgi:glycosyltransferase involved in cell wall biosynthesis